MRMSGQWMVVVSYELRGRNRGAVRVHLQSGRPHCMAHNGVLPATKSTTEFAIPLHAEVIRPWADPDVPPFNNPQITTSHYKAVSQIPDPEIDSDHLLHPLAFSFRTVVVWA